MKRKIKSSTSDGRITVGDLKRWLADFNDDDTIVVAEGSEYVYDFDVLTSLKEVRNQWGPDFDAVVIATRGQIGRI